MRAIKKRFAKSRPGLITRKARLILDQAGDYYQQIGPIKRGHVLPEEKPEFGYRYDDEALAIRQSRSGLELVIECEGEEVFKSHMGKTLRFNYGSWVDDLDGLYRDLKSKQQRARQARRRDL